MKNLTWQNPEQLFVAQELINKVKSKCCGIKGKIETGSFSYYNTDLFVSRLDGTGFAQLTYHAADDLSPVWSKDGRYIYFVSQRGNKEAKANIWRMTFNY